MRFAVVDTLKTGEVSEPLIIQEENEISKKKIGTTSIIQYNENNIYLRVPLQCAHLKHPLKNKRIF
jgi:hypothetical protein